MFPRPRARCRSPGSAPGVAIRQHGFGGSRVKLMVRENDHLIAQQEIVLKPDVDQSETILFNSGAAGAHSFQIGIEAQEGEQNKQNNAVVRLWVNVSEKKMRILYVEGWSAHAGSSSSSGGPWRTIPAWRSSRC